ncbi:MAG: hypothetical protein ACE5H4_07505 [Candidatus Thorarchaeota archaeon]
MLRRLRGFIEEDQPEEYFADVSAVDSEDVFLVTDPNAVERYRKEGRLDELKHDIRFSVMRGRPWQQEELEYVAEVRRLLGEGVIKPKGTWWWASPHPTVYTARKKGHLHIAGKVYKFGKEDEITFQCRMEREKKGLDGPLIVGRFSPTDRSTLCGDMGTAMKGM